MTKTINLKTKTARNLFEPDRETRWQKLPTEVIKGVSLGFKRAPDSGAETWHGRLFLDGKYHRVNLGAVTPDREYKIAYREVLEWAKNLKDAGIAVAESYTLQDVIDEYLTKLQGNSSSALDMDNRRHADMRLNALLPPVLLRRKVNDLTPLDITRLQREYSERENKFMPPVPCPITGELIPVKIAKESVNRVMVHLIAALNYGLGQTMIADDKAWKTYKRLKEAVIKRNSKKYIAADDRQAFIEACPAALKAIVSAMNITAARPSEVRRLRVSDVDFDNPDPDERGVALTTYKGNGSVRLFRLPKDSTIYKLFKAQTDGKKPDDYVFLSEKGKPWEQANLAKAHNKVRDDGGFSDDFETYVWRHCRISDWANANFPAPQVARTSGTSLEHIQKNYYKPKTGIEEDMAAF
jgi:integrase